MDLVTQRLTGIFIYPLKSASGARLANAHLEPWGLPGDRCRVIVDADGRNPWLGENPRSLAIRAHATEDGGLILRADGRPDLGCPPRDADLRCP